MYLLLVVAALLAWLAYYLQWFYDQQKRMPPGPKPLPLLGNLHQIEMSGKGMAAQIAALGREYGGVFTWWMPQPTLVITDHALAKQAAAKDEFSARPFSYIANTMNGGPFGIVNISGEDWREQRRFLMTTLHNFGFGKNVMQEKTMHEVHRLLDHLSAECQSSCGSAQLDPNDSVMVCVGSIVAQIVFSQSYDFGETRFCRLRAAIEEQLSLMLGIGILIEMMPWLRYLPLPGKKQFEDSGKPVMEFYESEIAKQKAELESLGPDAWEQPPADLVHAYLAEMHRRQKTKQKEGYFSERQLLGVVADVWQAGLDTTVATVNWAILFAGLHPEAQERLHQELDSVVGDRELTMADKTRLPYLMAFITETQRRANIISTNVPHMASQDTPFNGYTIPKGTKVQLEFSAAMLDADVFPEPERFDPERFLGPSDAVKTRLDRVTPFSAGKRVCIGESLTRQELFLLLGSLFQRFDVSFPDSEPSTEPVDKLALCPQPFKAKFTLRNK